MRQTVKLLVLILGVFGIAMGLLLRFYDYPRLAVVPLDPHASLVLHGTATVVDPATLKVRQGIPISATLAVRGKLDAAEVRPFGSVAVWDVGQVIRDGSGAFLGASEQVVCVDRRTAMAVTPCMEQRIDHDTGVRASGLQLKFPFNTRPHDYTFYDSTARMALPARYEGTESLGGLTVYRFFQTVPAVKLGDVAVPGRLVGRKTNTVVRAARMYEGVRTLWIEPYTGQVVKTQGTSRQFLRGPDGRDGLTLFQASLGTSDAAVYTTVATAKVQRGQVQMMYDRGPRLLICVGGGFFLTGLTLLVTGIRPARYPIRRLVRRMPKEVAATIGY